MSKSKYACEYCKHTYKEKYEFDRHILCCEFFYKSKKAVANEIDLFDDKIPNQREMYRLMQHMMVRIDKLEKENQLLKRMQKQKINMLEWLNQPHNILNITVKSWIATKLLPLVSTYLESVFDTDLITAMKDLFDKMTTEQPNTIPIRCYTNKQHVFYVYQKSSPNEPLQWIQIRNPDLNKLLSAISHKFLIEFNNIWCVENQQKIDTNEDYQEMYRSYYKKILGGDEELRNKKLREHLYKTLKQDIKAITEYEFG